MTQPAVTYVYDAIFCDHSQMTECCPVVGCGHFSCPCGISWDEYAEGHFDELDEPTDPSIWEYAGAA